MKFIKISYQCNYCKGMIDSGKDDVVTIKVGRVGPDDEFVPDSNLEPLQGYHYHDYCFAHIMGLTYDVDEKKEEPKEEKPKKPKKGKPFKKLDIDRDEVVQMREEGLTLAEIAEVLGCSAQTVANRLDEEA